ncbi:MULTISPECIES: RluA family pseudouridine synthase [Mucilaginibacter]|jgi:23S rRNA pseudouridine955/2504/2580 synthase|uniref:RluA family pseudouridine synthase n=1 Tax=Mucilaginibacter TaxID=423349 RepID=UPI0008712044|nr:MULTISPECIES: RluA family pseudouridine synthase [Mucilaginibacter]NVM65843.1 23S rRNA pseudouridine955/2504/2580 synthase [Mucilaginibacter sp. SG538B]WPV00960.1 RluA family pseudouridine synthase [Mucilaginibacter gossypii]GGB03393.1 RNA pseudouridine synthase [Mucilaginibacter rubeus]SCW54383.1 23S rRNA pseudouridine955/2504/2580 synthase [Mucilaginibacter sp. NFR10]
MKFPKFADLILFENDDVIVVNKPPFISSLDERGEGSSEISMLRLAKAYWDDAQICHRLDKETSGALIFAKNPEAYRSVSIQFEKRKVKKVYHAVIDGTHTFDNLLVDLPILNVGKGSVTISRQEGKRAETWFQSLKYYKHYTLVECRPVTGRMHQIRIHLATQRASIAGDEMYKGEPVFLSKIKRKYHLGKDQEELPIMKRFALHAYEVTFRINPETEVTIHAPYPKDFETLLKLLDKFDS